jgi:hypothetical protein
MAVAAWWWHSSSRGKISSQQWALDGSRRALSRPRLWPWRRGELRHGCSARSSVECLLLTWLLVFFLFFLL